MQHRRSPGARRAGLAGLIGAGCLVAGQQAQGQIVFASGTVTLYNPNSPPLIKSGAAGVEQIYASCAQLDASGSVLGYYTDIVTAGFGAGGTLPPGLSLLPALPVKLPTSTPTSPKLLNLRVQTSPTTPAGNYSLPLLGSGTGANPKGPPCTSYYGSLAIDIFPTLFLTHPALMTLNAAGSPATGKAPVYSATDPYPGQLTAMPATTQSCVVNGALYNACPAAGVTQTSVASNNATFTLTDPPNPGTAPNPGILANLAILYNFVSPSQVRGYGATAALPAATFGMSCYSALLESDWGNPLAPHISPYACKNITYQGTTYAGTETNPFGGTLPGLHCKAFDLQLALTGAAELANASKVKYTPAANGSLLQGTVTTVAAITGTQDIALIPGRSGARDMSIIPAYVTGNSPYSLELDQAGRVVMDDSGAGIAGYRVGLFYGLGQANCAHYKNAILVGGCVPGAPGVAHTCPAATRNTPFQSVPDPRDPQAGPATDLAHGLLP